MTKTDLAWLAGLLEGEGCFSLVNTRHSTPAVTLRMRDRDVVTRAHRLIGATGRVRPERSSNPRHSTIWQFGIWGAAAIRLMRRLLPFMGKRRTAKIMALIAEWESR